MPSIWSLTEGPKYGKITYFGYSGRHQVHMNFQPSPPPSPHVATTRVFTAATAKITCSNELILFLKKLEYIEKIWRWKLRPKTWRLHSCKVHCLIIKKYPSSLRFFYYQHRSSEAKNTNPWGLFDLLFFTIPANFMICTSTALCIDNMHERIYKISNKQKFLHLVIIIILLIFLLFSLRNFSLCCQVQISVFLTLTFKTQLSLIFSFIFISCSWLPNMWHSLPTRKLLCLLSRVFSEHNTVY